MFSLRFFLLALPLSLCTSWAVQGAQPFQVTAHGQVHHAPALIVDGRFVENGSSWDGEACVWWEGKDVHLVVDLLKPMDIQDIRIQVDNNDDYLLEGSLDGKAYTPLFTINSGDGQIDCGMDRFSTIKGDRHYLGRIDFAKPFQARYLRIQGLNGDECYSISEITLIPSAGNKPKSSK